ncbi:MAG TPA: preprotein translocase subunit SecG, partial [Pyrinomonadaceae bacterium]|nr:preprotein translocase subunit SecG [Pyrinomonadaceae bacterium]
MLSIIIYALFALACVVLILAVLLQPGKADAGALFTSSVSSTAFGPRGTQTLLAKITIAAAAAFMLAALIISMGIGTPRSVVSPGETGDPAAPAA